MDGNVLGIQIVPDQMQVVNPGIVLLFIPLFDRVLYPTFTRLHVLENTLHRMIVGGIAAGCAFISAGMLELVLETTYPELPGKGQASINFINTLPCKVNVYNPFTNLQEIHSAELFRFKNIPAHNNITYEINVVAPEECGNDALTFNSLRIQITAIEYQVGKYYDER